MAYSSTVTSKGQITLPAASRRNLSLKPGQSVLIIEKANSLEIIKDNYWEELDKLHVKVAAHLKKHRIKPLSNEELDDAINEAAELAATERYERTLNNHD